MSPYFSRFSRQNKQHSFVSALLYGLRWNSWLRKSGTSVRCFSLSAIRCRDAWHGAQYTIIPLRTEASRKVAMCLPQALHSRVVGIEVPFCVDWCLSRNTRLKVMAQAPGADLRVTVQYDGPFVQMLPALLAVNQQFTKPAPCLLTRRSTRTQAIKPPALVS